MTDDTTNTTETTEATGASRTASAEGRAARLNSRRSERTGLMGRFLAMPTWGRLAVGVPAGLLVAVLLLAVVDVALSVGRIHPGVRVSGVSVGMLTRAAAEERLAAELGPRLAAPVTARYEAKSWDVPGERLGVKVDARESVERALAVGNTGGPWRVVVDRFRSLFVGSDVTAKVDADLSKVSALLDEIDDTVAKPATDATVEISGTTAKLVSASLGVALRRPQVTDKLLAAFASDAGVPERSVVSPSGRIAATP